MNALVALIVVCSVFIVGCESKAEYHLRQLSWHGKESKDADKQKEHAGKLVQCGDTAVPLLIDEIQLFRYNKQIYSPSPIELLQRIGDSAATQLRERIENLSSSAGASGYPIHEQRLVLIATLILISDDTDYLGQWLSDAENPATDWRLANGRANFLFRLEDYFKQKFPDAPPFLNDGDDYSTRPVNQEFKKWWQQYTEARP